MKKALKQPSKKSKTRPQIRRAGSNETMIFGGSLPGNESVPEQNKPVPSMPAKLPFSRHPIAAHVDKIRDIVHSALADAGISGLSLRAMQFDTSDSCSDPCPPGQRRTMVCRTMPNGSQVCTCECVPI